MEDFDKTILDDAKTAGFRIENWLTQPPKVGLFYCSPEQLQKFLEIREVRKELKNNETT